MSFFIEVHKNGGNAWHMEEDGDLNHELQWYKRELLGS